MRFLQEFYLGFDRLRPGANPGVYAHVADQLRIRPSRIDTASGFAGSYHVLEMGRHYSEYVRYPDQFPAFRRVPGFPAGQYLRQLDTKSRASNVTGNIGEIVAGVVARRTLKFSASRVAHVKTTPAAQTPDYLLRRSAAFDSVIVDIVPALGPPVRLPERWPMESKARGDGGLKAAVRDAMKQLAAYWYHNRDDRPQEVGYGIVVGLDFRRPRRVRVHIFAPSDQPSLLSHLRGFADYETYRENLNVDPRATGGHLMGYA